ncbi:MAG: ImmA/IrrE family metallo-endopeptidase, partial [Bacteroidetes bacterium]|nr:ImmA/IrrE family metallo-endopeptidase [Bacteroidota bacterium]
PELLKMQTRIKEYIFPELAKFFQEDSIQFGKTIRIRKKRNLNDNPIGKNILAREALKELKTAIEIPLEIAELCVELAEIGNFVFDNAFQGARGDSQVALSGAVSALGGCLSIINLNLLSFGSDEYSFIKDALEKTDTLKIEHVRLNVTSNSKIEILENELKDKLPLYDDINKLISKFKSKSKLSDSEIENSVIELQNLIWKNRKEIWKKESPEKPIEILKPGVIFKKALGFDFGEINDLGLSAELNNEYEIAGFIDQKNKIVLISKVSNKQTQNFTAAHELGHAMLHKQAVMHRDRPMDGSVLNSNRNVQELQADKFASYFLMPSKIVTEVFHELFLVEKFTINPDTAFYLTQDGAENKLRDQCKNLRGLSRKLASTDSYRGKSFNSISKLFNVSDEAMAIRLEELNLVEF